ncbi:PTS system beta-glucoside-specific IIA component (Glc family) /PTS system beta-glucoside-specific IIB component (Glc family) /PTS system beta-glucoside-specific IIC component (Glc family) [Oceanotoga teriensis]|uniref:PTS system beta-glucoside-specific IIA component (Glc family) /PTS system beta-glucoside-specific IIB component (Glc family) /PTS system beta-glucoside-specific IIC component (Glc family) n=1 Tax=Oceanotoga teriensis TaxID=515440 RepID=A0AA45C5J2_9BACT|nr:beta-glucoside-specific PTS transporter subunit IIABC [Oceanotoga teriensis]PWJ89001.1 PTS system beta-glucoside-specific IIA component (Glc family) /PTS system beta-glucoside-specific IIB component (Glc family) /PTS system beta-glucoside-specific IIC component (Glc family) [Oceanotoga teriensis]
MNYKDTAVKIIKYVGGKENISHFEKCSTRLRFTLKDDSKVDVKNLERISGVMGVRMTAQCQVIIGNEVIEVYNEVIKIIGDINKSVSSSEKKRKLGTVILDFIVGVFQPLVPAIAGGGVLKSLLLVLSLFNILDSGSNTYKILNMIGDAPLYFLPILVAITTASKLKVNHLVALSAVGALLLPNMGSMLKNGELFGFGLQNIAYAYQIFPAILTVFFYAFMEKTFTKISPKAIRIFFVPMMSLVITVPVSLLILGPLGYNIGQGFAAIILFIFGKVGWIATALLAAVLPFMVATGMHKAMIPYAVATMGELGKEILYLPASLAHNISESGTCFAIAIKAKDKNVKSTAISAAISALFGITEPALYGVTLQNKKALGSVMIGSLIGGAFIGITGVEAFVLVGPGLASMTMYVSEKAPMNIVYAIIGFAVSFLIAFVSALFIWKEEEINSEELSDLKEEILKTPVIGETISISDVKDDVFSAKIVGDGIAIIPENGEIYAPTDAKIKTLFETNHAIGMKTHNGAELLIHVGIDTVKLEGRYFEPLVKIGDEVKKGDLLLKVDFEKIKKEGFDPVTVMVITNSDEFDIKTLKMSKINKNDDLLLVTPKGVKS